TTGRQPQTIPGIPTYPAGVGLCVTQAAYDPASNPSIVGLPTGAGLNTDATPKDNRYLRRNYTDDNLAATIDSPNPAQDGERVFSATYLYDGEARRTKVTDALGHQQTTRYFADGLVDQVTSQPNNSLTHVMGY